MHQIFVLSVRLLVTLKSMVLKEFGSESQMEEDVRRMRWEDSVIILRSCAALDDRENRLINVVEVGTREDILSERDNSLFVCWWDDPGDTEDMMEEKREICHSALQKGRTMGPWTSRGLGIIYDHEQFIFSNSKASYLQICIATLSWNGEWVRMLTSDSCSHWNNQMWKLWRHLGDLRRIKWNNYLRQWRNKWTKEVQKCCLVPNGPLEVHDHEFTVQVLGQRRQRFGFILRWGLVRQLKWREERATVLIGPVGR